MTFGKLTFVRHCTGAKFKIIYKSISRPLTSVFSHGFSATKSAHLVSSVTEAYLHLAAAVSGDKFRFMISFPVASLTAFADIFWAGKYYLQNRKSNVKPPKIDKIRHYSYNTIFFFNNFLWALSGHCQKIFALNRFGLTKPAHRGTTSENTNGKIRLRYVPTAAVYRLEPEFWKSKNPNFGAEMGDNWGNLGFSEPRLHSKFLNIKTTSPSFSQTGSATSQKISTSKFYKLTTGFFRMSISRSDWTSFGFPRRYFVYATRYTLEYETYNTGLEIDLFTSFRQDGGIANK